MIAKNKKTKKDSNFQTIFFSLLIGIFLLGSVGFLIISNFKINQKRGELTNKIESLKKEVQALEEKNKQLQAGISQTESESYWEEKAREQGFVREGEQAVVVKPVEEIPKEEVKEQKNLFQRIFDFFRRD